MTVRSMFKITPPAVDVFEVLITIRSKSVNKINEYKDKILNPSGQSFSIRMNDLVRAKLQYPDCICFLEETGDWKAFFLKKDHTDKIIINLRVQSKYFRNVEEFIDNVLIKSAKVRHKDITINIDKLLPDKNFSPLFLEKKFIEEIVYTLFLFSSSLYLGYLKLEMSGKYSGIDLVLLLALANFGLFIKSIRNLYKYKGRPWIKK